jgi:hypothetical protein
MLKKILLGLVSRPLQTLRLRRDRLDQLQLQHAVDLLNKHRYYDIVARLTGAIGQRVWVMFPKVPEWRYGLNASPISWYPSLIFSGRTFRVNGVGCKKKCQQNFGIFCENKPSILEIQRLAQSYGKAKDAS